MKSGSAQQLKRGKGFNEVRAIIPAYFTLIAIGMLRAVAVWIDYELENFVMIELMDI